MSSKSKSPTDIAPDTHDIAILLVDVINHLDFEGNEELLKVAEKIGKRIAALKEAARKAEIPVIYVNDNFGKWKSDFRHVIEYVIGENTPGKPLAELLLPNENDYFILKPKHSGFYSSPLDILLDHLGTKTLIITGFAGNVCVLFTANDGFMRNFKIIVPKDCIGSNTTEINDGCIAQMEEVLKADTRPSTEIIKELKKMPKTKKSDEDKSERIIRKQ